MALINCPECGGRLSSLANTCPHCGYPINNNNVKYTIYVRNARRNRVLMPIVKIRSKGHIYNTYDRISSDLSGSAEVLLYGNGCRDSEGDVSFSSIPSEIRHIVVPEATSRMITIVISVDITDTVNSDVTWRIASIQYL